MMRYYTTIAIETAIFILFLIQFLRKQEEKLCMAQERRLQHLEAVKERQRLIAAQGEAARLRYLTVDVTLSDDPEDDASEDDASEQDPPKDDALEEDTSTPGGDGGQSKTRTRSDEEQWGVPSPEQTSGEQQHALEGEGMGEDDKDDNSSLASSDDSGSSSEESGSDEEESNPNIVATWEDAGVVTGEEASANGGYSNIVYQESETTSKKPKSILLGRKVGQSEESGSSKDSLANRSKLKRNISFNRNVRILQFTKDLYSERTSSTELVGF